MTNDSNDILYREFFIQTTRDKLQEMTEDLIRDERVKDFGKVAEPNALDLRGIEVCITDMKLMARLCQQAKEFIAKTAKSDDTNAQNLHRRLGIMGSKIIKKLNDKEAQ